MIDFDNRSSLECNLDLIESIAKSLTKREIELILTSSQEMQEINKQTRNIDKSTDVLSFPYEEMPMFPLGSIVISAEHVQDKAKEFGHSNSDEFALLFIHGMLHLLGYDHEVDNGEMRAEELKVIQKFNLPESLIVRTQG